MIREADRLNAIAAICHGDERSIKEMRANIAVFASRLGDPTMTRLVNDVLAGRASVREVFRSPQFNAVGDRHLANIEAGLDQLDDADREALLAKAFRPTAEHTSDEELAQLRDADLPITPVHDGEVEAVPPPPPPPPSSGGTW